MQSMESKRAATSRSPFRRGNAKEIGTKALRDLDPLVSPATLLRWHRSVPNRIRVADAHPTDDSAIGATQASEVPLGRYGEIEELANLMMLLLSDGCDYLTGETICIDGGHHLAAPPTFAGLSKLSDDAWRKILESSKTASAASKAQRTV